MMVVSAALVLAALPVSAVPVGPRYGDTLAAMVLARFHLVKGLRISTKVPDGRLIVVTAGQPATGVDAVLRDAMGRAIGTVTLSGRSASDAARVATYLGRRIYKPQGLDEPDPFVPGAMPSPRGQALVDLMLVQNLDLLTLALHVGQPSSGRIVASSFGRIGKTNDVDDRRVASEGVSLSEVTDDGARLAIELPLLDRAGKTIGALSTSFRILSGGEAGAKRRALTVRAALARSIPSVGVLEATTTT